MAIPIQHVKAPLIVSRKLLRSIESALIRFGAGTFSESDVKLLVIELREFAGDMHRFLESNQALVELRQATLDFLDICNFVAHPDRNRGRMESNIREFIFRLYKVFKETGEIDFSAVTLDRYFQAHRVVDTMVSLAMLALDVSGRPICEETAAAVKGYSTDLELCLMSILQDSRIKLIDKSGKVQVDAGFAALQLTVSNGQFALFCGVTDSPIERDLRASSGGSGTLGLGFAVMVSRIKCTDPLMISSNPADRPAPLFAFERDEGNVLRLRRIS